METSIPKKCQTCDHAMIMKDLSMVCAIDSPKVFAYPVPSQSGGVGWATCSAWPMVQADQRCSKWSLSKLSGKPS